MLKLQLIERFRTKRNKSKRKKMEKRREEKNLRILLPWPTWYIPQENVPKVARKMATALGPLLGMRRANRTGANPPGGGPSWRTGMSLTLAIPGLFLITASVIFFRSLLFRHSLCGKQEKLVTINDGFQALLCFSSLCVCEKGN